MKKGIEKRRKEKKRKKENNIRTHGYIKDVWYRFLL